MARAASLRASDADREQVAERLRQAAIEGRLTTDELEERLEAASAARTYGELDLLLADLPVSRSPSPPRFRVSRWIPAAGAAALVFAVLSLLAGAHRDFAEAAGDHAGLFANAHHLMAAAASIAAVFAIVVLFATVVICAALLRCLQRSRHVSRKLNGGRS